MTLPRLMALALTLLVVTPLTALAQNQPPSAASSDQQMLKSEELDALVAGIALYPDTLVSLVLMASTYPLEIVHADRWVKENQNLKGDELKAAVDKQAWDDSVKSLVATPDVLSMMSTKLDWTQKLGDAVLAQQPDVMDAIQRLRTKADANKKLTSTKEQKVTKKQEQGKEVIVIEPTDPDTIYVPYYDPAVVYGGWPYPAYPPYYFPPPGYIAGGVYRDRDCVWRRLRARALGIGRKLLGRRMNWGNNNINVNRPSISIAGGNNWQHNPHIVKASNTTTRTCSRSSETAIFVAAARIGRISVAATASRSSSLAAVRPTLAIVEALIARAGRRWRPRRCRGGGRKPGAGQRPVRGGHDRPGQRPAGADGAVNGLPAAAMPSEYPIAADRPTPQSARGHASLGGVAAVAARAGGGGGGGGARRRRRRWRRTVAGAVVADDDPISRSSTTSFFSASSTTALVSIASAIMAAIALMSA